MSIEVTLETPDGTTTPYQFEPDDEVDLLTIADLRQRVARDHEATLEIDPAEYCVFETNTGERLLDNVNIDVDMKAMVMRQLNLQVELSHGGLEVVSVALLSPPVRHCGHILKYFQKTHRDVGEFDRISSDSNIVLTKKDKIGTLPNNAKLRIRSTIEIKLHHQGAVFPLRMVPIDYVRDLRTAMREQSHDDELIECDLTVRGQVLDDNSLLVDEFLVDGSEVYGIVRVNVIDSASSSMPTTVVLTSHASTLEELEKRYAMNTKRPVHPGSFFEMDGNALQNPQKSLFDAEVQDMTELTYVSAAFSVTVKEGNAEPVQLSVRDHYSAIVVKEVYNMVTGHHLTESDAFVFNRNDLDPDKELWEVGIEADSVLHLEREDVTQWHRYTCADCGSDVKLKRTDIIRCRECGYRIVYKPRSDRPCQYRAR